jgi:hypothetical protein
MWRAPLSSKDLKGTEMRGSSVLPGRTPLGVTLLAGWTGVLFFGGRTEIIPSWNTDRTILLMCGEYASTWFSKAWIREKMEKEGNIDSMCLTSGGQPGTCGGGLFGDLVTRLPPLRKELGQL